MFEDGEANDVLGSSQGNRPAFRVVQPKRIRVVDDIGSRAFELGERVSAVAIDAAMIEGTVGWEGK